jgi:hypothetical protein
MDGSLGKAAAAAMLAGVVLLGCGKGEEKFRAQLDPVVAKITGRANDAAALTGGAPAAVIEKATALQTDLAGLGADLKAIPVDGEKQQARMAAGQAYLSAVQRFIAGQQEFARSYARLEAARKKVRESLDAKLRTSKFSMDFWKESHDRLLVEIEAARKDAEKARDRLVSVTSGLQQAADVAGSHLGRPALVSPATLETHRKALAAVPLEKGA